jgi:hypothetical protein
LNSDIGFCAHDFDREHSFEGVFQMEVRYPCALLALIALCSLQPVFAQYESSYTGYSTGEYEQPSLDDLTEEVAQDSSLSDGDVDDLLADLTGDGVSLNGTSGRRSWHELWMAIHCPARPHTDNGWHRNANYVQICHQLAHPAPRYLQDYCEPYKAECVYLDGDPREFCHDANFDGQSDIPQYEACASNSTPWHQDPNSTPTTPNTTTTSTSGDPCRYTTSCQN